MTTKSVALSDPRQLTVVADPDSGSQKAEEEKEHERKRELITWTIFWCVVVTIVLIGFLFTFFLPTKSWIVHPTKFLIAMAVFSTAIFALYSVLLPFLQPGAGLKRWWRTAFFSAVILYTIASFGLGFYYSDLALHAESQAWINLKNVNASINASGLAGILSLLFKGLFYIHTFIFVLLIFIMDFCAYRGTLDPAKKDEFRKISYFIDVPMVAGVGYANLLVYWLAREAEREFFLAGAVALQLLVANMQLLLFPYFYYFRDRSTHSVVQQPQHFQERDMRFTSPNAPHEAAPETPVSGQMNDENVLNTSADGYTGERQEPRSPKSVPGQGHPDSDGQAAAPNDSNIASPTGDPDMDGAIRPR
jgi:hypothetical protein